MRGAVSRLGWETQRTGAWTEKVKLKRGDLMLALLFKYAAVLLLHGIKAHHLHSESKVVL